jgi:hypothetical protein
MPTNNSDQKKLRAGLLSTQQVTKMNLPIQLGKALELVAVCLRANSGLYAVTLPPGPVTFSERAEKNTGDSCIYDVYKF